MASYDERFEFSDNSMKLFNRSLTVHSSEFQKKPPLPCNPLQRNGSIKKLYNSSFESVGNSIKGKVRKLCSIFESTKSPTSVFEESQSKTHQPPSEESFSSSSWVSSYFDNSSIRLPAGSEDRIVVYLTSLRGIRRTYEDCCAVGMIFRGFRVMVDERDISMDSAYKEELQSVLFDEKKKNTNVNKISLPQVFIRGKYIGGADVIKQLHEVGELAKMLKGLPIRPPGYVCDGCGDMRFVPCSICNGSRKVYDEDEDQLKRCLNCNENGLIRCPTCSCSS